MDRPFDARILRRARAIAARYQLKLWREDGHWYGTGIEEPGAMGDGRTIQQAAKSTRETLVIGVAYLIESGRPVVTPNIDQETPPAKGGMSRVRSRAGALYPACRPRLLCRGSDRFSHARRTGLAVFFGK